MGIFRISNVKISMKLLPNPILQVIFAGNNLVYPHQLLSSCCELGSSAQASLPPDCISEPKYQHWVLPYYLSFNANKNLT